MAIQFVWRHPRRDEAERALYVYMRMMHIGGWRHIVVCTEKGFGCYIGVEMAERAREDDARDWSQFLEKRYRVELTLEELTSEPMRWREIYIDGGVGALLNEVERMEMRAQQARDAMRYERGNR